MMPVERIMDKRGAYFFVIDAFIAVSIIIATVIIIFSAQSTKTESKPTLSLLQDFMAFMSNTKIRDLQGSSTQALIADSNITDIDNTVLEQIIEFYYINQSTGRNMSGIITQFINETSSSIIPETRSFTMRIYNDTFSAVLFNKSRYPEGDSSLMLGMSKIGFKRINQTEIYGPMIVEVKIWV
jgi:hypothetical protein